MDRNSFALILAVVFTRAVTAFCMLTLKIVLSILLTAAGLYATFRRFDSADFVFNSPLYHRVGVLLTTLFLIMLLWQWLPG